MIQIINFQLLFLCQILYTKAYICCDSYKCPKNVLILFISCLSQQLSIAIFANTANW